jgi:hypothetical protein
MRSERLQAPLSPGESRLRVAVDDWVARSLTATPGKLAMASLDDEISTLLGVQAREEQALRGRLAEAEAVLGAERRARERAVHGAANAAEHHAIHVAALTAENGALRTALRENEAQWCANAEEALLQTRALREAWRASCDDAEHLRRRLSAFDPDSALRPAARASGVPLPASAAGPPAAISAGAVAESIDAASAPRTRASILERLAEFSSPAIFRVEKYAVVLKRWNTRVVSVAPTTGDVLVDGRLAVSHGDATSDTNGDHCSDIVRKPGGVLQLGPRAQFRAAQSAPRDLESFAASLCAAGWVDLGAGPGAEGDEGAVEDREGEADAPTVVVGHGAPCSPRPPAVERSATSSVHISRHGSIIIARSTAAASPVAQAHGTSHDALAWLASSLDSSPGARDLFAGIRSPSGAGVL